MSAATRPIPERILALFKPGEITGEPCWNAAGELEIPLADRTVVYTADGAEHALDGLMREGAERLAARRQQVTREAA